MRPRPSQNPYVAQIVFLAQFGKLFLESESAQIVMTDILAVLGIVALFLLSLLYVLGCERLK